MGLSPVRTPNLQLGAERPSTGGFWNPPQKGTTYPGAKEKPQDGRRGAIRIKTNTKPAGWATHKLENKDSKVVLPRLWGFQVLDFPTWGSSKGTGNPQGIWSTAGFDYRTSTGLGETETLGRHKQNLVSTKTQGKGAVTPQKNEPYLPASLWGSLVEGEKVVAVKVLHSICQQIWKTQQWSQDWERSVFIPVPKKGNAKECSNYCIFVLISHASKVMLKILQARLQQYMNCELTNVQAGFRKSRGTRDQIANIHWIIEKAREFQRNIYFCFIDYAKDFDFVDQNKLWKVLQEGNTRPPYLPPEKSICRSRSNS